MDNGSTLKTWTRPARVGRHFLPILAISLASEPPGVLHNAAAAQPADAPARITHPCAMPDELLAQGRAPADRDRFESRGVSACGDDGRFIDVLMVYTPQARSQAGGTSAIETIAQSAIAMANAHLSDSGVPGVAFRLVNTREVVYDEFAGSPDGVTHLQRLSGTNDGFMDEVHLWRDQDRADLVALIVATTGSFVGGVGWANVYDAASGFTVCERQAAIDGTFTHEWGHNLGLFHQCESFAGDYFRYARGYLWNHSQTGAPWATAMVGFSSACPVPPNRTYIPRYSNPDLFYQGERTGVPLDQPGATHEALTIRETHRTVANFRQSLGLADCNQNGISDAVDIAGGASQDVNRNGRPDECEVRLYVNINTLSNGDGSSWLTARRDLAEAMRVAALPCSNVREIWVAQGTYKPDDGTGRRDLSFTLGTSVQILGGFVGNETAASQRNPTVNVTTLSGDIGVVDDASDNSYSVIIGYDVGVGTVLDGFTIRGGAAWGDGGGLYLERASPTIRNCVFTGNHANGSGGGAKVNYGGAPRFEDCVFGNNSATYGGGGAGVYLTSGATFVRCTFEDNEAAWSSGLTLDEATASTIAECEFLLNDSAEFSGAVGQGGGDATYANCLFDTNSATTYGGGLYVVDGGVALLEQCQFLRNHAGSWGGGVAVLGASAHVSDCTFSQNIALSYGGGVMAGLDGAIATFRGCTFGGNVSTHGGGVSGYFGGQATFDRCVLIGNHALAEGGGIDVSSASAYVSRTRFLGNHAALDGGGLFGNNAMLLMVVNSEFSGCRAEANGGGGVGLYLGGSHTITSSTFAGNAAGSGNGGAVRAFASSFTMHNTITWADVPNEIGLVAGSTATITYSNVQGGFAGAGNTNVDPLFVDRLGPDFQAGTLDDDLRLHGASPCIDAGNTTLLPPDLLDLDGDGNVAEPTPLDLAGAARAVDDPGRPNTGVGTPPIDKGAYERPRAACPGDLNGDGSVGLNDLTILLSRFGTPGGATAADGDFDGDGDVDLQDLTFLLSNFGVTCG